MAEDTGEIVDTGTSRRGRPRFTAHELLVIVVGVSIAAAFLFIVVMVTFALVFVTQPLGPDNTTGQSANDKAFIDSILVPIVLFATGALSGVLASNGLSRNASTRGVKQQSSGGNG